MIGLLRTILIIVLVYYLVRFVVRILVPFIMKRVIRNYQDQFNRQQSSARGKEKVHKNKDDKLGDYVDYEEVKD